MNDDRVILIESDDDSDFEPENIPPSNGIQFFSEAERQAHRNALERNQREYIKCSFNSLKELVPTLQGEAASRPQILKETADFILFMKRKNFYRQKEVDDLKRENKILQQQIQELEQQRSNKRNGGFPKDMTSKTSSDELTMETTH